MAKASRAISNSLVWSSRVPARLRNEDDQAGMNVEPCVLPEEVPPVNGDDDVVVLDSKRHKIPVLPTALADVGHIGGVVATRFRDCDKFASETLVDQKAVHQSRGASDDFQSGP